MSLKFLDTNWIWENGSIVSASSSDPLFPPSNLQQTSRSSVWHSSGNFTFAGNVNIDFKESSGGSAVSAVIAAGSYTPSTLAAAIVAAMQSAGTMLYVVVFSTGTGKWTISTSNGTFLSLLWSSGTNHSTSIGPSIGFAVSDQTGALTYTGSNIAIHTDEWLVFDLQTAVNVDSFAMLFHPTRGIRFSLTATIHLQANATNSWGSPAVDVVVTPNETFVGAVNFFNPVNTYRYWRLHIVDPTNTDLFVEVSKVCLAQATVLSRPVSNAFFIVDSDTTVISETPYGNRFGDVYPVRRQLTIPFTAMSYADLSAIRTIYKRLGQSYPFIVSFIEFAGGTNAFTNEDFLIYGCFPATIESDHHLKGYFDQSYEIDEVS